MRRNLLAALIPLLLVPRLASPQGEPLGPEFRVNTATSFTQGYPSVAAMDDDFVVVWHDQQATGDSDFGVVGQRYDVAGNPLGTEFHVNTYTPGNQRWPDVGANASGTFVVVWRSDPGSGTQVRGQRYAASGVPLGSEFLVTSGPFPRNPKVAVTPSGSFVVVWEALTYDVFFDVLARRYDSTGAPLGGQFRVNTYTTADQYVGDVAADPAGNFVVVWMTQTQYPNMDVSGQRYAASGDPLGPEFRVNTFIAGSQTFPTVATDSSGNFVVAWANTLSGPNQGLLGQRFASSGAPLGLEFRINTSIGGAPYGAAIAVDDGGNFVVVWDGTPGDVLGQRYSSLGAPSGPEFRVNTTTLGWQREASVASTPGGIFLVTWESTQESDIYGQRFGGIFPVELQDFRLE